VVAHSGCRSGPEGPTVPSPVVGDDPKLREVVDESTEGAAPVGGAVDQDYGDGPVRVVDSRQYSRWWHRLTLDLSGSSRSSPRA
jgi:hypothetical protein